MTTPIATHIRLELSGTEITLGLGHHVLGRAPECAVCIDDPRTSRRHAVIEVVAGSATIRDLGSRNRVLVNGAPLDGPLELRAGDRILLGSQAIHVREIKRGTAAHDGGLARAAEPAAAPPHPVSATLQPETAPTTHPRVPPDIAMAMARRMATTLSHSLSPLGQPVDAFRLIAEAAQRALSAGETERAVDMLEAPLVEVLATLRAGIPVDAAILDIAIRHAMALHDATGAVRWAEYLSDLHAKLGRPVPPEVARRMANPG